MPRRLPAAFARRFLPAAVLGAVVALALALPADAHALVRFSDPPDGAILRRAPQTLTISFTEVPDPKLSYIRLLDIDGKVVAAGPLMPIAGEPLTIQMSLPLLADGSYTVSWRTVSATDGHLAVGAFAFAIGADAVPPIPSIPPPPTIPPSPLGVAGHWALDAAYGLLLGGAWVALLGFPEIRTRSLAVVGAGAGLGVVGIGLLAEAGRENAGMDLGSFLNTAFAGSLNSMFLPIVAAAIFLAIAWVAHGRLQRVSLGITALFAGLAMLTNALASHAASSRFPWLMIPAQWLHLASFAVWIGGLAAILVGIRGRPSIEKAQAVGRFSTVAAYAFAALALSGVLRGLDDLKGWASLFTTVFGLLLLVKTVLFVVVTPLAAMNRWRYVRMGIEGIRRLRLVAGGEVALAAIIMVAAAFLTAVPPPSFISAQAARPFAEISTSGVDDRNAVRVTFEVAPGRPGPNRFIATVRDTASGRPVDATHVFLLFDLPMHPELGESNLELSPIGSGLYTAAGTKLSLAGRWTVTVVVETASDTFDVVLPLTTR